MNKTETKSPFLSNHHLKALKLPVPLDEFAASEHWYQSRLTNRRRGNVGRLLLFGHRHFVKRVGRKHGQPSGAAKFSELVVKSDKIRRGTAARPRQSELAVRNQMAVGQIAKSGDQHKL